MKKSFLALAAFALLSIGAVASAQVTAPQRGALAQNDLVQVVPNGQGSAQAVFAPAGEVAGQLLYSQQTPVTAFAITVPAHTSFLYLTPAGTLATGALTMEANPSDGQKMCLLDTQTQTAVTISGNTGQTIGGLTALTALTAGTTYCYFYNKGTATWYRVQ